MQAAAPKAVLIDLDGVLHVGGRALPGAIEALDRLRAGGLSLRFLTNTTRSPRDAIAADLRAAGFRIAPEEIQTAAIATRELVARRHLHPHYLVHPRIAGEMGPSHEAPDAVVIGDAGPHFDFDRLNAAFRLLMEGLPLIAMARNRYFREADGLSLDLGAFVAALEYAAGIEAEVVGKPARPFFQAALDALDVEASQAVLIGDDVRDDVAGALDAGIPAMLVRTGKFRPGDDARAVSAGATVADDFSAAVAAILAEQS